MFTLLIAIALFLTVNLITTVAAWNVVPIVTQIGKLGALNRLAQGWQYRFQEIRWELQHPKRAWLFQRSTVVFGIGIVLFLLGLMNFVHPWYPFMDELAVEMMSLGITISIIQRLLVWIVEGSELTRLKQMLRSDSRDVVLWAISDLQARGWLHNGRLQGIDLSNTTRLQDVDLQNADLSGANFRGANITGTKFSGAKLIGAIFENTISTDGTSFRLAKLNRAQIKNVEWHNTDFMFASLDETNITRAKFANAEFDVARFLRAKFTQVDFTSSNFREAKFTHSILQSVHFDRCDLQSARFEQTIPGQAWQLQQCGCAILFSRCDLKHRGSEDSQRTKLNFFTWNGICYDQNTKWPSNFTPPPENLKKFKI